MNINLYIDHTLLKPTATIANIHLLCSEAVEYSFAAVCVPPPLVTNAVKLLQGTGVKTATVIGFPFGYSNVQSKKAEAIQALKDGGDELDMVINLLALKNGAWSYLEAEVKAVLELVHGARKVLKVIIESGILSDEEIIRCCEIYAKAGVDYVKTSTGYAERGATIEAVRLMKNNLPASVLIKASGGIKSFAFAKELVEAGASRLGCSASIAIATGENKEDKGY